MREQELRDLEANESRRFANRADATVTDQVTEVTGQDLLGMELNELRRFRNRAPSWALPQLDDEIERLRHAIAGDRQ